MLNGGQDSTAMTLRLLELGYPVVSALNPPERVADMIGQLTEIKKIQG